MPGKNPTDSVKHDLELLAQLIRTELSGKDVTVVPRANSNETGECNFGLQPEEPAVCVDIWR